MRRKAVVNRKLLGRTAVDSAALNSLGTIIHRFGEPGHPVG